MRLFSTESQTNILYRKTSIGACESTNDVVVDGQKHQICLVLKFAI